MNRAQSEVVGLLFIFSITFVSISVILLTGFPILDNATENTQLERFQNEFSVLDQEIRESVYAPGQSGATISLSDRRVSIDDGSDSMAVEITYRPDGGTPVSTREINLGGVEFDARGDRGVAYEAGGIWSKYRGGGLSMRTPPDISYSGDTLNMNLMNFVTDVDVGGDSTRTFVFSSEGAYRSSELRSITDSSLESGELEISVRSHYADGWAEYFNRTMASSTVDVENVPSSDDRGFANVTLRTGPPLYGVEYLSGRYGPPSLVNVTDSRVGDMSEFNYTFNAAPPSTPLPVDSDDIEACLLSRTGEPLPPPSETVTAGVYETDSLSGDYEFDTSSGSVELLVDSGLTLDDDISVEGTNPVIFHVSDAVDINSPDIDLEGDRADLLQVYSGHSGSINVEDFTGALYAPESDITVTSGSVLRGAAIGNNVVVSGDYYHDAALRRASLPDCIDPPLRNFNAVERRVSVR